MSCPYEKNTYMEASATNLTFVQLQEFLPKDFDIWADKFRAEVVYAWDELGIPVLGGQSADAIADDFKSLAIYDVSIFDETDEFTGEQDCILNQVNKGGTCNQFFPTMLKTKDITATNLKGSSIYSYFAEDEFRDRFVNVMRKMVEFDQLNMFSALLTGNDINAVEWVRENNSSENFWLCTARGKGVNPANITHDEAKALLDAGVITKHQIKGDADTYEIRLFKQPFQKVMDSASMFRICFGSPPATNFPPLTAKYLYLKFTEDIKDQEQIVVYDPSAGWGGRILGAMSCCNERPIHYIGTDPNTDHIMPDLGITKYEYLADYFNGNITGKYKNTYEIFRLGSEVIRNDPEFQNYEGKVDFIFTSPPYFAAESYSDDDTQSLTKFPEYHQWREGFLLETLRTCVDWLKEDRWLCWNIADVALGSEMLPLQEEVKQMGLSLGLEYHGFLKMVLRRAPTGMPTNTNGVPTTRNFCRINNEQRKFAPVLMFKKPLGYSKLFF
jgi:hypothetical protein